MLFKSKYLSLAVYSDGKTLQFKKGLYETTDKKEIATLKSAIDVAEVIEVTEEKQ